MTSFSKDLDFFFRKSNCSFQKSFLIKSMNLSNNILGIKWVFGFSGARPRPSYPASSLSSHKNFNQLTLLPVPKLICYGQTQSTFSDNIMINVSSLMYIFRETPLSFAVHSNCFVEYILCGKNMKY